MAKKKTVEIVIKLKDGVTASLSKIGGGLKRVASGFKNLAVVGVAATAAVIGGLTALAKAYGEQETVNKKMKDTFDAAGESGAKAVVKWGAWATAIQRVTTLGDEEIMNLISLAKTMGISNDKIAEATKGAIGLSKAFGIDLNSSMKMVALATQGEYTMLQRYIPALREANTEAEKAAVVQKAMADGFKVAAGELDTIIGQWTALKGVIGDAMQEIGRVLFGDGGLTRGLEMVKNKIIELTEGGAITNWAKQAKVGLDAVAETIKLIAKGGDGRSEVLGAVGAVIKESFRAAALSAAEILLKYGPAVGKSIAFGVMDLLGIKTKVEREQRTRVSSARTAYADELKFGTKASQETALNEFNKQFETLQEIIKGRMGGEIGEVADLAGKLDDLGEVLRKFGTDSAPNRKKLAAEMGLRVEKGAEKGAQKGTEDGINSPKPGLSVASLKQGTEGLDYGGGAYFMKQLMTGQEGQTRRESFALMSELVKSGGSGQLEGAADLFKELTSGQQGLKGSVAIDKIKQLVSGGALGEGNSILELFDKMTQGQDKFSKMEASDSIAALFGMDAAGGLASGGALGGATISAPSASEQLMTANGYLKTIAENTAGGLF